MVHVWPSDANAELGNPKRNFFVLFGICGAKRSSSGMVALDNLVWMIEKMRVKIAGLSDTSREMAVKYAKNLSKLAVMYFE